MFHVIVSFYVALRLFYCVEMRLQISNHGCASGAPTEREGYKRLAALGILGAAWSICYVHMSHVTAAIVVDMFVCVQDPSHMLTFHVIV